MKSLTGDEIRQDFIDFFVEHGHTAVPSTSLVPGGDATLLFTNSGMVQFKDVFLGTDKRPYTRAVDSQKCMRVAGKHNDLDDVGRDDTHHTFFEMLGNWSFGDYYKKEAIAWSWQLLTDVWGLHKRQALRHLFQGDKAISPPTRKPPISGSSSPALPATCPVLWAQGKLLADGRVRSLRPVLRNPLSTGARNCDNLRGPAHECGVNGECTRYLELWNNVFIQYNLFEDGRLEPLPAKHVDTGMGFERIVSVLQDVEFQLQDRPVSRRAGCACVR